MNLIPEKYFDVCPNCGGSMKKDATGPEYHQDCGAWLQSFTCKCCGDEYFALSKKEAGR